MKTFKQFNKEVNEAAALVTALPKIAKLTKFTIPAAMTLVGGVGTYLQSKKDDKSKSNGGPFRPMSDFDASLSRSKYGPGGPQKKDDNKLSNLEIIRQELQKRLKKGAEGKFRRGHSGKFQQTDAELKKKIDEIGKKIKDQKDAK